MSTAVREPEDPLPATRLALPKTGLGPLRPSPSRRGLIKVGPPDKGLLRGAWPALTRVRGRRGRAGGTRLRRARGRGRAAPGSADAARSPEFPTGTKATGGWSPAGSACRGRGGPTWDWERACPRRPEGRPAGPRAASPDGGAGAGPSGWTEGDPRPLPDNGTPDPARREGAAAAVRSFGGRGARAGASPGGARGEGAAPRAVRAPLRSGAPGPEAEPPAALAEPGRGRAPAGTRARAGGQASAGLGRPAPLTSPARGRRGDGPISARVRASSLLATARSPAVPSPGARPRVALASK